MNLFLPRLRELLAESGKMQKDICDELGISKQKLSNWKTGSVSYTHLTLPTKLPV